MFRKKATWLSALFVWLMFAAGAGHALGGDTGPTGQLQLFHNGGTGSCDGCHIIHPQGGIGNQTAAASQYMLLGSDPGSTCLMCHQKAGLVGPTGYFISTPANEMPAGIPPKQLTPGGDFGWLNKNYPHDSGYTHGHDIVAADYGYDPSPIYLYAPGGAFPSGSLTCTSCHDPHGTYRRNVDGTITTEGPKICASGSYDTSADPTTDCPVGVYRLLGGAGYQPDGASKPFMANSPAAVAPSVYNRSESLTQTRVAYGSGMSEWCANCHTSYLSPKQSHPAGDDVKLRNLAKNYNMYSGSGDDQGSEAASFLSLVPFEEGTADYAVLKSHAKNDDSYLHGPDGSANVMCLTCHRAHASGWIYGLRFTASQTVITASQEGKTVWPGIDTTGDPLGRTSAETSRAYYDMPASKFSRFQHSLCNKCHIQD